LFPRATSLANTKTSASRRQGREDRRWLPGWAAACQWPADHPDRL